MTNIYLYGELKNKFGGEFKFNINSPKEAFSAINANRRGFCDEVKRLAAKGILYRVIVDDNIIDDPKELSVSKAPKEIHILPMVWGAGSTFKKVFLVIAAVIIAIYAPQLLPGYLGKAVAFVAAAVALQGIMSLLYPQPKPDFNQEVAAGAKSYLFSSKQNNVTQGQAIPVGYGRLLIGSSQINANISSYPIKTDIKTLMAPVDRPIDDYTELEFSNEDETASVDSFYTNQSMGMDEVYSFTSVNVLNSYSNIVTRSTAKVTTEPVEVVVRRNGELISNSNFAEFDPDIEYSWEDASPDVNKGKIKIENPYSFDSGIVFRAYFAKDFKYYTEFDTSGNNNPSFFISYPQDSLVRYGPAQFRTLLFSNWDTGYIYKSGELSVLNEGGESFYYKAITGGKGVSPTDPTSGSSYWAAVEIPQNEDLYRAKNSQVSGALPTETDVWEEIHAPLTTEYFDQLTNYFGAPYKSDKVHVGGIDGININRVRERDGASVNGDVDNYMNLNADNYMMEFLGFYKVPFVRNRVINIADAEAGAMYEVVNVGATGVQWTGAGLTGQGGSAIPVLPGVTFTKNSNQVTGDGTVLRVATYKFKLDSDDASDLYIDGQLASSYYGNHGPWSGFANYQRPTEQEIENLHSTTVEIPLTVGYHRLYTRFQDALGGDDLTIYRKYDTNGDNSFSDWQKTPKEELFHRKISDFSVGYSNKFLTKNQKIPASSMVIGKKYRIVQLGTVNWGSIGASSPKVGTVFYRRAGTLTGSNGFVFEETFSHYEAIDSSSNRIVVFSCERPIKDGVIDRGLSYFKAKYKCKVTVDGIEQNTAPVKINVRYLPTEISLQQENLGTLSVPAYTDV
jgi:predicted phage tail protein